MCVVSAVVALPGVERAGNGFVGARTVRIEVTEALRGSRGGRGRSTLGVPSALVIVDRRRILPPPLSPMGVLSAETEGFRSGIAMGGRVRLRVRSPPLPPDLCVREAGVGDGS